MNGTLILIELAGHVGILLWGTHMVGSGVQRGFGTVLRQWMGRNLDTRFSAFFSGLGVTTLLQSSTATSLLATSFAATGVIALAPALTVMLGANVGTALLTQLLSFDVSLAGPPLVLAGVLAFRWASTSRAKNLGRVGIGLGLMLMALAGLVHTLGPLQTAPLLRPLMDSLSGDPVLAVLVAAMLTWACHSSIAIVLLIGSLQVSHVVGPIESLALVLGANLGGALPAFLDASSRAARRLPLGNLLIRCAGIFIALPLLPQIAYLFEHAGQHSARMVVNFHLLFNVVLALASLGPVGLLARTLTRWLPDLPAPNDPARPMYLDSAALESATVALANASRETLRMADMVDSMLRDTLGIIYRDDRPRAETVSSISRAVDRLGQAIRRYLADVGDDQFRNSECEGARGQEILSAVINLEHAADIIANSLVEFSLRSLKRGEKLAAGEFDIVAAMHAELIDSLRLALAVFLQGDPRDASRLVASKAKFREFESSAMVLSAQLLRVAASMTRLADNDAAQRVAEESGMFLRTVRDLRRIHSHLASFAYPVLHGSKSSTPRRSRLTAPAASEQLASSGPLHRP